LTRIIEKKSNWSGMRGFSLICSRSGSNYKPVTQMLEDLDFNFIKINQGDLQGWRKQC